MEWISVKERLPQASFVETEDPEAEYESYPVLLLLHDLQHFDIVVGWYEIEDLSPFPGIPRWVTWNGENIHWLEGRVPTHWMPLPNLPSNPSSPDSSLD